MYPTQRVSQWGNETFGSIFELAIWNKTLLHSGHQHFFGVTEKNLNFPMRYYLASSEQESSHPECLWPDLLPDSPAHATSAVLKTSRCGALFGTVRKEQGLKVASSFNTHQLCSCWGQDAAFSVTIWNADWEKSKEAVFLKGNVAKHILQNSEVRKCPEMCKVCSHPLGYTNILKNSSMALNEICFSVMTLSTSLLNLD